MNKSVTFSVSAQGAGVCVCAQAFDGDGQRISIPQPASRTAAVDTFDVSDRLAPNVTKIKLYASTDRTPSHTFGNLTGAGVQVLRDGELQFDFDLHGDFSYETAIELGVFTRSAVGWDYVASCTPVSTAVLRQQLTVAQKFLPAARGPMAQPSPATSPAASHSPVATAAPAQRVINNATATRYVQAPASAPNLPPSKPPPPAPRRSSALPVGAVVIVLLIMVFAFGRDKSVPPVPVDQQSAVQAPPLLIAELTQAEAMNLVYGSYDPALQGTPWIVTNPPPKFSELNAQRLFVRPIAFMPFVQGGVMKQLLLTSTSRYGDTGEPLKAGDDCHACGVLIGATVFEKWPDGWRLETVEKFLVQDGSWGTPPQMQAEFEPDGALKIAFSSSDMAQGVVSSSTYRAVFRSGTWTVSEPVTVQEESAAASASSIAASASSSAPAPRLEEPSFDCTRAKSAAEKLICSDRELAQLDREVAALYAQRLSESRDSSALRASAIELWKQREAECDSKECLLAWYVRRRQDLEAHTARPSPSPQAAR